MVKNFLVVSKLTRMKKSSEFSYTTYRSLAVWAGHADWVWTKRCEHNDGGHGDGAEDNVE